MKTSIIVLALISVASCQPYWPSGRTYHGQQLVYSYPNPRFVPTSTYQTVQYLRNVYPDSSLYIPRPLAEATDKKIADQLQATVVEQPAVQMYNGRMVEGRDNGSINRRLTDDEKAVLRQILGFCTRKLTMDSNELA